MKLKKHIETIKCPECGKKQKAEVWHTYPWWSYVHTCISCNYLIMESEWDLVKKKSTN
jgi:Zn ribbon nucleic-acid-binding protein